MLDAVFALPPGVGQWLLAGFCAASFLGSFISTAFGIGGGGLLLAILASLMPPTALIPVHGVVQLGSNAVRASVLLRSVAWAPVPAFALGSLAGVALGGLIVVEMPPGAIEAGVGLFILWTVFARPPAWLSRRPGVTGAVSSVLTMFFGATGLLVAAFTKSLKLARHAHVATHAALMTMQHGLKVVAFAVLGFAYADWLAVIAAMIAAGVAGTLVGRLMLNRLTDTRFRLVLDAILVVIAARLVYAGALNLVG